MRKIQGGVSHHEREVSELRADPELAIEYLRVATESIGNPDLRTGGLLALQALAEAYGGLGAIAAEVGLSKDALHIELSQEGQLPPPTLLAILRAVEVQISLKSASPSQA
jgi:DNA-binding phage protein